MVRSSTNDSRTTVFPATVMALVNVANNPRTTVFNNIHSPLIDTVFVGLVTSSITWSDVSSEYDTEHAMSEEQLVTSMSDDIARLTCDHLYK